MTHETPTQSALLDELESIRSFLSESEPRRSKNAYEEEQLEIPILTSMVNEQHDTESAEPIQENDDAEALHAAYQDALRDNANLALNKDRNSDTVPITHENLSFDFSKTDTKPAENKGKDTKPSPKSQNSQKHKTNQGDMKSNDKTGLSATKKAPQFSPVSSRATQGVPKGSGENPFLPPHIRERLGKHKEMIDQFQEALESNPNATEEGYPPAETDQSKSPTQNVASAKAAINAYLNTAQNETDKLIDDLVAEYLPRIENRLREKLKERLAIGK